MNKELIKIGLKVNILGSDGNLYQLLIVSDDNYKDEDNEISLTEAFYYQSIGELFEIKIA
jgi:hypothetical protein